MFSFVSVLLNNVHCATLNCFSRSEGALCTLVTNLKCVAVGRMKFRAHYYKEAPHKNLVRNWMPDFKETGSVNDKRQIVRPIVSEEPVAHVEAAFLRSLQNQSDGFL